ncbi:hypothetical protein HLBS07_27450 [Vibrio alginolyticus]|nr:hypothetical protein HLBS07_27450 [Vibrio alginolyticus]
MLGCGDSISAAQVPGFPRSPEDCPAVTFTTDLLALVKPEWFLGDIFPDVPVLPEDILPAEPEAPPSS